MKERDKTIDNLRGVAMIWVIVVHVLYWGNFFENDNINLLKSFCLFEMPLFFFVSGASNSFGKTEGYFSFVLRRYKRMLIPYWIYAVICTVFSIIYLKFSNGIETLAAMKILISWLIPVDRQITSIPYLTYSLWFVPVYLCIVLIIPVMKRIKHSPLAGPFIPVLFILFSITCILELGWIQNVAFYSLWTYIGLFYNDIKYKMNQHSLNIHLGLTAAVGIAGMFLLYILGYPLDMQYNKFPPNMMFAFFSLVMISWILFAVPYINKLIDCIGKIKVINKVLELFSTRSMTIFLYQAFAFNLTMSLANKIVLDNSILEAVVKSLLCLILTIPICTVLAMGFGKVEQLGVNTRKKV